MRHIIAENGASSSPNIVALCCSKAGAGKFFVSASATILLVLHLHQHDDAIFDELVDEMLTRINVSRPLSVTWVLLYRSSLPTSLAAYHSLSAVLRDTLFCFTDFQLIGPPFIIIT
jgi:hypothetical protein